MHGPVLVNGKWLRPIVQGYINYHAVAVVGCDGWSRDGFEQLHYGPLSIPESSIRTFGEAKLKARSGQIGLASSWQFLALGDVKQCSPACDAEPVSISGAPGGLFSSRGSIAWVESRS
jgi:hypothetical protein